jgi:hypothetical protein
VLAPRLIVPDKSLGTGFVDTPSEHLTQNQMRGCGERVGWPESRLAAKLAAKTTDIDRHWAIHRERKSRWQTRLDANRHREPDYASEGWGFESLRARIESTGQTCGSHRLQDPLIGQRPRSKWRPCGPGVEEPPDRLPTR